MEDLKSTEGVSKLLKETLETLEPLQEFLAKNEVTEKIQDKDLIKTCRCSIEKLCKVINPEPKSKEETEE
jgi:redox-regulated HSP33 family molecular chaperone